MNRGQRGGGWVLQGVLPMWCLSLHIVFTLMLSGLLFVPPTSAAVFIVNSVEDLPDLDPGNGVCVAYIMFVPPLLCPPILHTAGRYSGN